MDAQRKSQIIAEAYKQYADKIKFLEFIAENDNEFGPLGDDGCSIFYPHNIRKAVEEVRELKLSRQTIIEIVNRNAHKNPDNFLFGFKYKGDEHIGYILKRIDETEPLVLKSGRTSKDKTVEKIYQLVAGYDFYTGNVDVILLDESEASSLEYLVETESPEKFLETYNAYKAEAEQERRSQVMYITVGLWEDMQAEIRKLSERIDNLTNDLSENYSRRYNSEEE